MVTMRSTRYVRVRGGMAWRRLCFYTQYYDFKNAKNAFDVGSLQLPTMKKKKAYDSALLEKRLHGTDS